MLKEIGEKNSVAFTLVRMADLSVEEGHPTDAEASCLTARGEFRKENSRDDEILADVVLVKAMLLEGRIADAEEEIDRARELVSKSHNFGARLKFATVAARVLAALGKSKAARKSLGAKLEAATRHGFVGCQFEARLALGEIEMKSGQTAAGRAHLQALETDAKAKGFLLISRKAAAALKQVAHG